MRRPLGITLSSIVLALFAAVALLSTVLYAFLMFSYHGVSDSMTAQSGAPAVLPNMILGVFAILAILSAGVTGWATATVVGLLRLRAWARYSVLVIGGLLTGLSSMGILGCIFLALFLPRFEASSSLAHGPFQIVLAIEAIVYTAIAAIGVSWLVYFNLRSTKVFFPSSQTYAYAPGAALPTRYSAPGRFEHVPTAILVLSSLLCISALCCLLCAFLPFPAFLFGVIITGHVVPILYIGIALIMALLGWGLFRLDNRARIATYALLAVGTINLLLIFTPWYQARVTSYLHQFYRGQGLGAFADQSTAFYSGPMLALSAVFGIAIYGTVAWILYHYRRSFTHPAPPQLSEIAQSSTS